MIFDNDYVVEMVKLWQDTGDKDFLHDVLEGTRSLIEVIVSRYDPSHRDDLIQEAFVRVSHAIEFYDVEVATLYAYLSAVIRNSSLSYIKKISKEEPMTEEYCVPVQYSVQDDVWIIEMLIVRNRKRFPSLVCVVCDEMTEYVYYAVRDGVRGKSRGAIKHLMNAFDVYRNVATVFYHSTMIYLRTVFSKFSMVDDGVCNNEFTLLPELEDVVGAVMYRRILTSFAGTHVKVP